MSDRLSRAVADVPAGRWRVALAVTLALITLQFSAACTGGRTDPASTPSARVSAPAAPSTRATVASDGGGLRVVEQGLSTTRDAAGKEMITYGIIVENTSKELLAAATDVRIRLIDASGATITDLVAGGNEVVRKIAVLFPGQRAGIAADTYVDRSGTMELSVEIGDSTWLPAGDADSGLAKLTTSDVKTKRAISGPAATITFTVYSEYQELLDDPSAQAIFRDSTGKIIGGTGPARTNPRDQYRPGRSTGQINVKYGLPAGADDAQTEVYVSPSCC